MADTRFGPGFTATKESNKLFGEAVDLAKEWQAELDKSSGFADKLANKISGFRGNIDAVVESTKDQTKAGEQNLKTQIKLGKASKLFKNLAAEALKPLEDQLEKVSGTYEKYRDMVPVGGKFVGVVAAGLVVTSLLAGAVAETRKDLGVSAFEAGRIQARLGAASVVGKLFGLSSSDIRESFDAMSSTLGGIDKTGGLAALNFARFSMSIGLGAADAANLLKTMESMTGTSREALQSQLKSTAQLIRQQGVAPGAVMKDIASQAEFFAEHSKAGSDNLFLAAAQARKLGLSMGTVANITDSLLDFESSINAQMEASVLLGREINTDRARQLAFTGDQAGLMKEVESLVGTEAEFNAMNVMQRKALAGAIGITVGELSKFVAEEEKANKSVLAKAGLFIGLGGIIGAIAGMVFQAFALPTGGLSLAMFAGLGPGAAIGAGIGVAAGTGAFALGQMKSYQGLPPGTGVNITGGAAMAHAGETIVRTESINMDSTNQLLGELVVLNQRMIRKIDGIGVS